MSTTRRAAVDGSPPGAARPAASPLSSGGPATRTDSPGPDRPSRWLGPLLRRLHFWAGILVGPFVLVAAVSGALYALTPQLEQVLYSHELHAPGSSSRLSLADQVRAADAYVGPDQQVVAVRPAPGPGDTTRVMYADASLGESQARAVFVDPATAEVRGDLPVYGTSGALPLRHWVSDLHRSLHLGDAGRLYSELAASWLGVVALAGAGLWVVRVRKTRAKKALLRPGTRAVGYAATRSWHTSTGVWALGAALFLSATGITWSQHAGGHVSDLRAALEWTTPSVSSDLSGASDGPADEHAHHGTPTPSPGAGTTALSPAAFDTVLRVGQEANITTGHVEIRPPTGPGTAWVVQEIQRSYPTEVDAVAVDGQTMQVVDRVDFADLGLVAKLSRWGVDLHMGTMSGLANQLVLLVAGSAIAAMVVWGYVMWWQRRPVRDPQRRVGAPPPRGALRRTPWWGTLTALAVAAALGAFLPLMGISLAAFLVVDALVGWRQGRRATG